MANITFPDGSSTLLNPAAYGEASAESRKSKQTSEKNKKTGEGKNSFVSFFESTVLGKLKELPHSEESLNELLDEVHSSGDALSKRPFLSEISAYRTAVRNFINYVVENTFDTEEQNGIIRRRKLSSGESIPEHTKYTYIKVIDTKLEGMAAAILRGQLNQLEILEKLDEIKGLLVDLLE